MQTPIPPPMQRVKVWLTESDYRALKAKAERDGISQSEAVRRAVARHLGEDAAGQSAPWLADMIDAVLAKYFQGFPQVLDRLVVGAFEQRSWSQTSFLKLLEATGVKDTQNQDERLAKAVSQITAHAREKADAFFQSLAEPEEFIEPPEPSDA